MRHEIHDELAQRSTFCYRGDPFKTFDYFPFSSSVCIYTVWCFYSECYSQHTHEIVFIQLNI